MADTLNVTQSTTLLYDQDGDGVADATGVDTLQTQVTIQNNATTNTATNVALSEALTNQTLVPGSVTITPIAANDSYNAIGNVTTTIAAGAGVLFDDVRFDSGTLTAITLNT